MLQKNLKRKLPTKSTAGKTEETNRVSFNAYLCAKLANLTKVKASVC